jgi:hypothetical protein
MAITYQLHPSSIVGVGTLLAVTLILAPTTVRWREIFLAAGILILLFFPYALLEVTNQFADIKGLLAFAHLPAHNDTQALYFYRNLILPFNEVQPKGMKLLGWCIQGLLLFGLMATIVRLFRPRQRECTLIEGEKEVSNRWNRFRFNPERVSCLLLLLWQIIPFTSLLHHSVDLHMQYLLLFLPGPFILMGLALEEFIHLIKRFQTNLTVVAQIGIGLLSTLLVIGQSVSSTAYLLKMSDGHFNDRTVQNIAYVNDLNSMWNAVHQADQLAQKEHISRIYVSMDPNTQPSMSYLGELLHTPTTVFGYNDCLVLPSAEVGPAVYLIGPYADRIDMMLHQFASVKLVAQPPRLGGRPFKLYIATPQIPGEWLAQKRHAFTGPQGNEEIMHQSIQREVPTAPRTLYTYQLSVTPIKGAKPVITTCAVTALHKHDILLAMFQLPKKEPASIQQAISVAAYDIVPKVYYFGSIEVTSFNTKAVNIQAFVL